MPIYEFYCAPCNTIYSFFSKTINTTTTPGCPKCGKAIQRQVSLFSCIDRAREDSGAEDFPIDESRLEGAMTRLTSEAEKLNENDPRQAAQLMRMFSDMTGVKLGEGMQEALSRLESGEDPDAIEAEMGDILQNEDPFQPGQTRSRGKKSAPLRDETLYDL
jgi:putative FmdB family regulatory protein